MINSMKKRTMTGLHDSYVLGCKRPIMVNIERSNKVIWSESKKFILVRIED